MRKMLLALTLLPVMWLTGCVTTTSDPSICPPVVPYSAADQDRAAAELDALPAGSIVRRMVADYGVERAKLRACRGG